MTRSRVQVENKRDFRIPNGTSRWSSIFIIRNFIGKRKPEQNQSERPEGPLMNLPLFYKTKKKDKGDILIKLYFVREKFFNNKVVAKGERAVLKVSRA